MNYCKYCGSKINAGSSFCTNCGNKIENNAQEPEIIIIDEDTGTNIKDINLADNHYQNCKTKINNNEQICTKCGNYLNNDLLHSNNQKKNNNYNETIIKSQKNQKRVILIFSVFILVLCSLIIPLLFINQGKDKNYTRTIMLYVVGSDLESNGGLATVDLDSINYNKMDSENVNIVMLAGGTNQWHNSYIDSTETSIYELTSKGFEKTKQQEIKNMGSADVLSDFLNYVYENYKTDKYDLIFWNHGSAIIGSEFDEISDDYLSLDDLKKGLSASPFNANNKIENVIFRTCLSGTIEMADVFSDFSEYLVASEEITLGSGMSSVLNFINEIETSDEGYDVGLKFINAYQQQIKKIKVFDDDYIYSTYSIVDLSNIDLLIERLNDFITDVDVTNNYNDIAKIRSNLYQYGYEQGGVSYFDMVDLYNLVDGIKDLSLNKAQKVLDTIEKTVVYNYATNDNSRGMSIYFPFNGNNSEKSMLLSLYRNFYSLDEYNKFISKFNNIQSEISKNYSFVSNKTSSQITNDGADFTLELTDEQKETFANAQYIVFRDNKDGYYEPIYKGKSVSLDENTLKANIADRQLKVISTNEEDEETLFTLFESEETNDYIKYTSVVGLTDYRAENITDWKLDTAKITIIYDKKNKEVKITNAILLNKNEDLPSNVVVDINEYQWIEFTNSKYKITDEKGNYLEPDNWINNGIIEGIGVNPGYYKFELENFDDNNDYYCVFIIRDTGNNIYYSKLIKMN